MKVLVTLERLNSKNFLVRYERKHWWSKKKILMKEEVMCEEDVMELIKEKKMVVKEMYTKEEKGGFDHYFNEYREHKKNGTSLAGERIKIENVKALYVDENEGVRMKLSFELVSAENGKVLSKKTFEMYPFNQNAKKGGLEIFYRHIFQLYFSGCHATKEDELICHEAFKRLKLTMDKDAS